MDNFSAEMARYTADRVLEDAMEYYKEKIEETIFNAATLGQYHCFLDIFDEKIKNWLENKGFRCSQINKPDASHLLVEWGKGEIKEYDAEE